MILLSGLKRGPEGERGSQAYFDDAPSKDLLAPPAVRTHALVRNS